MKKLTRFLAAAALFLWSQSASASVLITEHFNYPIGKLSTAATGNSFPAGAVDGNWYSYSGNSNYIQVVNRPFLQYPGYQTDSIGHSVELRSVAGADDLLAFNPITSGSIYAAALIKVSLAKTGDYVLAFGDNTNSGMFGRVYVKKDASGVGFQLGVSKGSENIEYGTTVYELNTTYLVVLKYEVVSGDTNDIFSLFVNPVGFVTEPVATIVSDATQAATRPDASRIASFNLRQGTAANTPTLIVDAIRVATTWAELFSVPPANAPTITITPNSSSLGAVYVGESLNATFVVKGENLTGDITITPKVAGHPNATLDVNTISKADAESAIGKTVTLTITPTNDYTGSQSAGFTFSAENATDRDYTFEWVSLPLVECATIAELRTKFNPTTEVQGDRIFKITGEVAISHSYVQGSTRTLFIQDASGGITIQDEYNVLSTSYRAGDRLESIVGEMKSLFGTLFFVPNRDFGAPKFNADLTPETVTFSALKATPEMYEAKLVALESVQFTTTGLFTAGTSVEMQQAGETGISLRVLPDVDFIGTSIPTSVMDVVGVSTSRIGTVIAPRSLADLQEKTTDSNVELLRNHNFETWTSGPFGEICSDWTFPLGGSVKEGTDVKEGSYAFKTNVLPQNTNVLQQEVAYSDALFAVGETYELTINYKVLVTKEGGEVKFDAFWESSQDGELTHDATQLKTDYFSSTTWAEKKVQTTVPSAFNGTLSFHFRVAVPKGATVLFDAFSFKRVVESSEKSLIVNPTTVPAVSTTINNPVAFKNVRVKQANLTNPVKIVITGDDAAHFSTSVSETSLPDTDVTFTYLGHSVGSHRATVIIQSEGSENLTHTMQLQGNSTDPSQPPLITVNPTAIPPFQSRVGTDSVYTITVTGSNLTDWLYASVTHTQGTGFFINSSLLGKNGTYQLRVTFRPTTEGTFASQLRLHSANAEDRYIQLTGTTTQTPTETPDYETEFNLSNQNPLLTFFERFDGVEHNKTLKGLNEATWKNVVPKGSRPWWGYEHKDTQGAVVEKSAKATAYIYQATTSEPWEMWMITPPMDFKNAPSKLFTFRVMGDFMYENHQTSVELYYIDKSDSEPLFFEKLEMPMPNTADQNGEWSEFHLDFTGQNIADIFFFGFKFAGPSGTEAVTYYIDDVSWGRTDVPNIVTNTSQIVMEAEQGIEKLSSIITVTPQNLENPITLTLAGSHAGKFKLSTNTLPTAGGQFYIAFMSDVIGVHEAYIKMSSQGAADRYIPISVNNGGVSSVSNPNKGQLKVLNQNGQLVVEVDDFKSMTLYDQLGRKVLETNRASVVLQQFQQGVYLLKVQTTQAVQVLKVMINPHL